MENQPENKKIEEVQEEPKLTKIITCQRHNPESGKLEFGWSELSEEDVLNLGWHPWETYHIGTPLAPYTTKEEALEMVKLNTLRDHQVSPENIVEIK